MLYMEYTYDSHFGPVMRLRSHDSGQTWVEEDENVPRTIWAHGFADGEYFEIDNYGFRDPREADTFQHYVAWTRPGDPAAPVRQAFGTVRTSSTRSARFCDWQRTFLTQPTHPWWRLLNTFELGEDKALAEEARLGHPPVPKAFDTGENVLIGGPSMTGGVEVDGVLLTVGYARHRDTNGATTSVFLWESSDRGRTWSERACVGRAGDTPEGYNESSLVRLKDGRLYVVMRTGGAFHHAWSSDLGRSWTQPAAMSLIDSDHLVGRVWPVCKTLDDGTLVLAYGRPGKNVVFDPTGTGTQWQGRLDLHALELQTQAQSGVPEHLRLRGTDDGKSGCVRQWDSSEYLFLTPVGPRELLAGYDVQNYIERPGDSPVSGVRMVRVHMVD